MAFQAEAVLRQQISDRRQKLESAIAGSGSSTDLVRLLGEVDASGGWEFAYHHEPAGQVSGDYCDLIEGPDGVLHFFVGDVSGKGVAASMLMAHLHALFRALASLGLELETLVARASRLFCESTLPTHYATLVCGRAQPSGEVEIANAGHLPALWLHGGELRRIESTGLPLGLFCDERFTSRRVRLDAGDLLVVYTDGLIEAHSPDGAEYGVERLERLAALGAPPAGLIRGMTADLAGFRAGAKRYDDATVLALGRSRP